jgi:2-phosphosulfolactate phosphatase
MRSLDALFTPAEYAALAGRDLSGTTCVVFDVLRATSTTLQALAHGARAIYPVNDIPEALACRAKSPGTLLAGERHGLRIRAAQTGGTGFDFGNSPREFTPERVAGREIAMTTTNGTLALRACAGARHVLVASFANLTATADWLGRHAAEMRCWSAPAPGRRPPTRTLWAQARLRTASGHSPKRQKSVTPPRLRATSTQTAQGDLSAAIQYAANGRRLLSLPELADDVPLCLAADQFGFAAQLEADGAVRRISTP